MRHKGVVSAHAKARIRGVTRFDRDYFHSWADAHADSCLNSSLTSTLRHEAKEGLGGASLP